MRSAVLQDPLDCCVVSGPTRWLGRLKLELCQDTKQFERLQQMPGVLPHEDPKDLSQTGWYVPQSIFDMGRLPANLEDYPPEPNDVTPSGIKLRKYEARAVTYLRQVNAQREGAILAADPGLGKTLTSLHALHLDGYLKRPGLVIGPNIAKGVWCDDDSDAIKHYHLRILALEGVKNIDPLVLETHWCFFCHYELLEAWQPWIFNILKPTWLVIDESHYLTNQKAQRSKAARQIALAASIERRYALTGTPIPNERLELWQQLAVVQPRQWGTSKHVFGVRHCLAAGANIMLGDYSHLPIEQLRVGDEVLGFEKRSDRHGWWQLVRTKVTAIGKRLAELHQLKLDDGHVLYTTEDHHWFAKNTSAFYASVRSGVDRGCGIGQLQQWCDVASVTEETAAFVDGWIRGVLDGDGHARRCRVSSYIKSKWGGDYTHSVTLTQAVPKNKVVVDRLERYAGLKSWRAKRHMRAAGEEMASLAVQRGRGGGSGNASAKACYEFATNKLPPFNGANAMFWRGWLGGMYDAEGSGNVIAQDSIVNAARHACIGKALALLSFDAVPLMERRKKASTGWRIRGGIREMLRFRAVCNPCNVRKLDSLMLVGMETKAVRIGSFVSTKRQVPVFSVTTGTGNYFAEGFASKNCDGHRNAPEEGGHWEYSGESNDLELKARLAGTFLRFTTDEVMNELPLMERHVIEASCVDETLQDEYSLAQRDIVKYLELKSAIPKETQTITLGNVTVKLNKDDYKPGATRLVCLSTLIGILSKMKQASALAAIDEIMQKHDKLVVFTWRIQTAEWIHGRLMDALAAGNKIGGKSPLIYGPVHGEMEMPERKALAKEFAAQTQSIYVATMGSAGTSINTLSAASAALIVDLHWNSHRLHQAEKRIHRDGCTAPKVDIYYLVARRTVDDLFLEKLREKAACAASIAPRDTEGLSLVRDLSPDNVSGKGADLDLLCARLMDMT